MKLNIGAGITHIPGFVNLDISKKADVSLDLNRDKLPFEDDSVKMVFSYHTLEHLKNYLFALGEIHRVLKHGGKLLLGVPHVGLTKYNLINPYHKQHFNEKSFDLFDQKKGSAVEENRIMFRKVFHKLHYTKGFKYLFGIRNLAKNHLFNVVEKIDFGLVAIKKKEAVSVSKKELKKEFSECLKARRKYE